MKKKSKRRAIFLDRDGVINQTILRDGKPRAPYRIEDFRFCPGVPEAVEKLRKAGYLAIVVTNQPDVARGWQTRESVEAINGIIADVLKVDAIEVCYHVNQDGCHCRKPKPGMLLHWAERWNIDYENSYMIGDRFSDVEAGYAAGCVSLLVGPGDEQGDSSEPAARVASLLEAAEWILSR